MGFRVEKYCGNQKEVWDKFVATSKNGTFLFHRDFMEYHSDRFEDFSLMVFDQQQLVSILPANISENIVHSHQGLTYGGLVFTDDFKIEKISFIIQSIKVFLKNLNISKLIIKQLPEFYNQHNTEIVNSALIKNGAINIYSMMNLAVDYATDVLISKSKLKHYRRIDASIDLQVFEETSCDLFWNEVLIPRLLLKFNTTPLHSLSEIAFLKSKFPEKIRQFSVYIDNQIIAGLTLFESQNVVKSQYGATTSLGEKHRALDFLFINLIEKYKNEGKQFFDMGTVYNGTSVNEGLLNQKVELGCTVFHQNYYELCI